MAKIKLDRDKCIGCSLCSELCPKTFEMIDDKVSLRNKDAKITECEKNAATSCPTEAIKISQ